MRRTRQIPLLVVYSLGHFLVDFACAFVMFSLPGERLIAFILYNFCAFALQMPAGLVADKCNRNSAVAAVGLAVTCMSFLCTPWPLLCATVAGVGNCLYHVGGGVDVLGFSSQKQWMLGVFVSPGALGLFLGTFFANHALLSRLSGGMVAAVLSLAVVVGLYLLSPFRISSANAPFSLKMTGRAPILAILCLFFVVVLRSYVGITLYTPWKNGLLLSILAVLGLALGKTAGGILADKFGALPTTLATLGLSSLFFLFSENAVFGLLAIFCFNMSMPLTLFALAQVFPGAKGFAFGCLTFALFVGCIPNFLSLPVPFYGQVWFHAAEGAVSLILLAVGLLACREGRGKYG